MSEPVYKESEIKHIEMIEAVIERMGQNSFALKGWTMTLIVAICALSATGSERRFAFIAVAPIIIFWFLDSYYLQRERKYRELYNRVIKHEAPAFSMDISTINDKKTRFLRCLFSVTEVLFYVVCIVAIVAVFVWLNQG